MKTAKTKNKAWFSNADPPSLQDANVWLSQVTQGLLHYQHCEFVRKDPSYKVVATWGQTRLLCHKDVYDDAKELKKNNVVIVVPSLINSYVVADLLPDLSLLRLLQNEGSFPLLIDWGDPTLEQEYSDLSLYTDRLVKICDFVTMRFAKPLLAGHCLGGLLSLSAGLAAPLCVGGVVLMSLPWDFSGIENEWGLFASSRNLRHHMIRDLFLWQNAVLSMERFRKFGLCQVNTSFSAPLQTQERAFIAIEDWLSTGYDMSAGLSADLRRLCGQQLHRHTMWWLDGTPTERLLCPCTLLLSMRDKIVPANSSLGALECLGKVKVTTVDTGHLGLIAGSATRSLIVAINNTSKRAANH